MISVERSVFLSILTLIVYTFSIYFQPGGQLVFPFPLYPVFLLVISVIYFVHERKMKGAFLLPVAALFGLFGAPFFWEIMLSSADQQQLFASSFTDIILLISKSLFIIWSIIVSTKGKDSGLNYAIIILGIAGLIVGMILNSTLIEGISFVIFMILSGIITANKTSAAIFLFLAFLRLTEWFTIWGNYF